MNKYPEYKNSGVPWLGNVPEHWEVVRLGSQFYERKQKVSDKEYAPLSVTKKGILPQLATAAKSNDGDNRKKVCSGDFVINSRSDRKGSSGVSPYTGSVSLINTVLSPTKLNGRYVHNFFRSHVFQEEFYRVGRGIVADLWSTKYADMRTVMIPVPPLPEQQQISQYLDWQTSKINKFIQKKKKLIELFVERRNVAINRALINSKTKHLRMQSIVEQVYRSVERVNPEQYTPIGLYNRGRGIFHKSITQGRDLGDSIFYWVKEGDLVISGQFAWEGAIAVATRKENGCIVSHRYPTLRVKKEYIFASFLWAFFQTKLGDLTLNYHSRGAAGRNRPLNIRTLMKEKIPVPPLKLQEEIDVLINKELKLKAEVKKQEVLLLEYKMRLISDVVTGKVDVRSIEVPDFEPVEADVEAQEEESEDESVAEEIEE